MKNRISSQPCQPSSRKETAQEKMKRALDVEEEKKDGYEVERHGVAQSGGAVGSPRIRKAAFFPWSSAFPDREETISMA